MADYFILQTYDQASAYAFKVPVKNYRPSLRKAQRERSTATGRLDVQTGAVSRIWGFGVKAYGDVPTGSFSVTPGNIMTASTVAWGGYDDLETLFLLTTPPANKLRFRSHDGYECYAYLTGELRPSLLAPMPSGEQAYMEVYISLRESVE